ncbi:MAG: ABC transporter ATP-binding protein, partial [Thermomicrobiales bacterium]|nr:ABC transporter ATP-binding protein [Thermomicrobiales bacterium]
KQYGGTVAVDGVDLDVRAGEFVSLLGPSGCGKTTTLRMIAGLETIDDGELAIDGRDVTDLPPQRRNLGMVFQQYALFPNLTAFENVAFALRVRRRPKAEIAARVAELLETVHLGDAASKYPHELSGGMQQRVALARALAIAPPLLLLDEPLSALDAAIRDSLRAELRRLQRQLDVTVIYVTHDQAEAMALSDTVIVMEKGKVSQIGTPRDLYDRPATRFTASFIGASNRRETHVEVRDGRPAIAWGSTLLTITDDRVRHGDRVIATWRPEAATIVAPGSSDASVAGVVELMTFLGPITRLDIAIPGDAEPVMVDLPSQAAGEVTVGQRLGLRLSPAAIRLFHI